jgi:hypothetical protein
MVEAVIRTSGERYFTARRIKYDARGEAEFS